MHILEGQKKSKNNCAGKNLDAPKKLYTTVKVVNFSEKYPTVVALLQPGANPTSHSRNFILQNSGS